MLVGPQAFIRQLCFQLPFWAISSSSHGSHFWWSWRACPTAPFCHLCVVPAAPSESESIGLGLFMVHRKMEAQRRPELGGGLKPQSGHIYQALQTGFLFESQLKMECKKME